MISLLLPTRGRPAFLRRLFDSIVETTERPGDVELVLYVDEDDRATQEVAHPSLSPVKLVRPRGQTMGEMNQACFEASRGGVVMLINDDAVFRTRGWDRRLVSAFAPFPDGAALVWGNDLHRGPAVPTFPALTRAACEALGGICPLDYHNIYIDVHLHDVFRQLAALGHERAVYLEDVVFEHMHHEAGKAPLDETYAKRREKDDDLLFILMDDERRSQAKALAALIERRAGTS
jgi:hypothetical protein